MSEAATRWGDQLEAWAIPEEIRRQATADPWRLPPNLFPAPGPGATPADTPGRRRALAALGSGGTVLDVGVGGGAASLPLAPPAVSVTGVDASDEMLAAFLASAAEQGVHAEGVPGRWPDVADRVPAADVVVCHHVFYNVADLVPFVLALTDHARRAVVVELSGRHPVAGSNPLWLHFWGLHRPEGPTADDAIAVLGEAGIVPEVERQWRPRSRPVRHADWVAFTTRRLCLPPERAPEVEAALARWPDDDLREAVTLSWPGGAPATSD